MQLQIGKSYIVDQFVGMLIKFDEDEAHLALRDGCQATFPIKLLKELPGSTVSLGPQQRTVYEKQCSKARGYKPSPRFTTGHIRVDYRADRFDLLVAHFASIGLRPPADIQPVEEGIHGGTTRMFGVSFHGVFPPGTPRSFFGDYEPKERNGYLEIFVTEFCKDCIAGGVELRYKK